MTVIDVNTGKFTGQGGNLEQTVTRNNLEAAEEIVRQLRVRDLGGIIVIDFIDMVLESNRELVLRRLLECLARDRTKHQVAEVTSLGLVQMTRKRVGSGLLEAFSVPCEHCNGRGLLISLEPVEHTHGREGGRAGGTKGDHATGNGAARDSGSRDAQGRDASRGSRSRGGSGRRDAAASGDSDARPEAADGAGPSPAHVASAGSAGSGPRSTSAGRGARSRAARPAGPPSADNVAAAADAGPASAGDFAADAESGPNGAAPATSGESPTSGAAESAGGPGQ
jgi:ribonuclease E